jgi:hypothetical protein
VPYAGGWRGCQPAVVSVRDIVAAPMKPTVFVIAVSNAVNGPDIAVLVTKRGMQEDK